MGDVLEHVRWTENLTFLRDIKLAQESLWHVQSNVNWPYEDCMCGVSRIANKDG